jgi:hypothetical protein
MGSTQVAQIVAASLAPGDDVIGCRRAWLATDPAHATITLEHQRRAPLHVMSPAPSHGRLRPALPISPKNTKPMTNAMTNVSGSMVFPLSYPW